MRIVCRAPAVSRPSTAAHGCRLLDILLGQPQAARGQLQRRIGDLERCERVHAAVQCLVALDRLVPLPHGETPHVAHRELLGRDLPEPLSPSPLGHVAVARARRLDGQPPHHHQFGLIHAHREEIDAPPALTATLARWRSDNGPAPARHPLDAEDPAPRLTLEPVIRRLGVARRAPRIDTGRRDRQLGAGLVLPAVPQQIVQIIPDIAL